ncbi:MAG TPA: hypothetical protein VGO00_12185 [Kofleriaceae bacterium]|nr:hypothetical protein [Kofleriaceae bacterium]
MRAALAGFVLIAGCSSHNNVSAPLGEPPDASAGSGSAGIDAGHEPPPIDAPVAIDASIDAGPDRGVEQDDDDLAFALAEITRSIGMTAMIDGMDIGYAIPIPGFTNPTPGEFSGTRDTGTFDYIYHCEDDAGNDNFTCGPTANHVHVAATIAGSTTIDNMTLSEDKVGSHWTVRNISAGAPQYEDTGRFLITCTLGSDGTRFQLTLDGTWNEVRFDPEPATTLPFAGNIVYTMTGNRHRAAATPPDVDLTGTWTMTFAAGGQATIAIDPTHNYAVDLTTGSTIRM